MVGHSCNWDAKNDLQLPGKMIRGIGNQRKTQDNPNHSSVKIGLNTQKSFRLVRLQYKIPN